MAIFPPTKKLPVLMLALIFPIISLHAMEKEKEVIEGYVSIDPDFIEWGPQAQKEGVCYSESGYKAATSILNIKDIPRNEPMIRVGVVKEVP